MAGSQVFTISTERSAMIVCPQRNITSLTEDEVKGQWDEIRAELDQPETKHIVFDFEKVKYFGSSMLEAMLSLWKRINAKEGKMAVCNLSEAAVDILRISRFDSIWPIYESRDAALDHVNNQDQS